MLTFDKLKFINARRCEDVYHPIEDWSPTDWGCAMAGEAGETCNKIKKLRRCDDIPLKEIGEELADTVIYADLLATRLGLDLGKCVIDKFNKDSVKRGTGYKLA